MPNNKVQLSDGTVLMDTSGVTVTPEVLMQGYTALDKTGAQITGTATAGGVIVVEEDDEHGGKVVHITGEVIKTQSKTVTPTKATQSVTPDTGYNALSGVTVNPIPDNYIEPSGSLTITENGQHSVSQYASVNVNVEGEAAEPVLQIKSVTPTESEQTVVADDGYDGLDEVTVAAISSEYVGSEVHRLDHSEIECTIVDKEEKILNKTVKTTQVNVVVPKGYADDDTIKLNAVPEMTVADATIIVTGVGQNAEFVFYPTTAGMAYTQKTYRMSTNIVCRNSNDFIINGTRVWVPEGYYSGGAEAIVQIPSPTLQEKNATPTESAQEIEADSGYDGLSKVTVGAISNTYVGSGITRCDSTDLSVNGATVTTPAGYYANAASKSVASGSATTPATTITAAPSISVNASGLITATASASQSVTPTVSEGYVSAGTAGTVTVSGSNTQQLTTQGAATITPTKQQQTAVTAGKYTTGAVTVAAIPAEYITTSDATAAAADILSGETAYVNGAKVTGTLDVRHIYVGTGEPSASLGENGDIYLQIGG